MDHANNMLEPLRRVSRMLMLIGCIIQALFENLSRKRLCDELGCEMYPVPNDMEAPFMRIVRLEKFKIKSARGLGWSVNP